MGILISIIISSIVYIGTATVLTGLVNYKELGISNVLSFAINKTDLPFMQYIVKIGALSALASVVMINQYSVSRMILTISKDGLLPISLSKIHKKYKAPTRIIIMIACAMIILTAFDDIANLARITGCLALVAISTVCFALIIFRFQYPCLKKGFVCPWVPVVPFLAIFSSIYVISSYEYKIYVQFTYIIIFISILYLALKYRQNHE